ncbi:hypothetical protein ACRAWF_25945 [Streptomyces sp. L7]
MATWPPRSSAWPAVPARPTSTAPSSDWVPRPLRDRLGSGRAIIADPLLGALQGHFAQLWALGALIVFASAATTVAFQVLWGVIGVGVTVLLFVVLGNPSAGGAYPSVLLPPFWAATGQWLPPGAGTTAVRNTVYFSADAIAQPLWVLAGYAVVGTAVAVTASALHLRRRQRLEGA